MTAMEIRRAGREDLDDVARLVWQHAPAEQQGQQSLSAFTDDLATWWDQHVDSHHAFLAVVDGAAVGIAWVALLPRVPRPGSTTRVSADLQSVYVVPEHRGRRIGAALVEAATEHGLQLGASRVTVHSSRKAVPMYERLGFAGLPQYLQREAD